MSDHDVFAERRRALEEEYFRKKDRELIEKMRQAAEDEQARREMGRKTGLLDAARLQELQDLGFTPETVILLPLVPVVETAWAEGGVSAAERHLIVKLARSRGVAEGSPADARLQDWMDTRPEPAVFERAGRLIRAVLDAGGEQITGGSTADDLVAQCEKIAAASGGMLGIIGRVSAEERELLARIASDLKTRES
jgi:hypothetical protein